VNGDPDRPHRRKHQISEPQNKKEGEKINHLKRKIMINIIYIILCNELFFYDCFIEQKKPRSLTLPRWAQLPIEAD